MGIFGEMGDNGPAGCRSGCMSWLAKRALFRSVQDG